MAGALAAMLNEARAEEFVGLPLGTRRANVKPDARYRRRGNEAQATLAEDQAALAVEMWQHHDAWEKQNAPGQRRTIGDRLWSAFLAGRWPQVERALLWAPGLEPYDFACRNEVIGTVRRLFVIPERMEVWKQALAECTLFAEAGFDIAWCDYGQHRYVRGDKRQRDCPLHNKAGEMWRTRQKAKHRKREDAHLQTLREAKLRKRKKGRDTR